MWVAKQDPGPQALGEEEDERERESEKVRERDGTRKREGL